MNARQLCNLVYAVLTHEADEDQLAEIDAELDAPLFGYEIAAQLKVDRLLKGGV